MVITRCCIETIVSSLLLVNQAYARNVFKNEAQGIERRQTDLDLALRPYNEPPGVTTGTIKQVLTFVTPSPGATPVAITTQSQVITSYVPQYTLCELPPVAEVLVTPFPTITTAPYKNYTISIPPGNGTCTTIYSPTASTICATVLTGLADRYTVSSCNQEITFSSNFGYALATGTPNTTTISASGTNTAPIISTITPAPTIQTLTTYYIAPWQQLTSAGPPTDVDLKICATYANGTRECVVEFFSWITKQITQIASTTTAINLTTTIAGPSQVIVETFVANITDIQTTFSLQTSMVLEYATLTETTSTATRPAAVSTGPTVYQTYTVDKASKKNEKKTTKTSTIRVTKTIVVPGTTTVTLPTAQIFTAAAGATTLDAASVLGIS